MSQVRENDSLSWGDALFLYLEREGMPLNIASVSVFEGIIPLDDCVAFIESKIPLIPRYRQRVVAPPLNIGLPSWEYDPEFDVRNHIREVTLKRGTEAELKAVSAKILGKAMDRSRPLWDLTLLHGLKGNRTGLLIRMHHCLADGIAGVGLMNVIMDARPIPPPRPKKKPRFRIPRRRDAGSSLLDGLINSYFSTVHRALRAQSEISEIAHNFLGKPGDQKVAGLPAETLVSQFMRFLPELTAPTERLSMNVTCGGPQKVAWGEFSLPEIESIRHTLGVTLNDVVLALVTSVFRRYAELRGIRVKGRLLRIMVPVNVRGDGKAGDLGNRISLLPVTVPLDIRSPRKLVAAIHERTQFLKQAHIAEFVGLAGALLGLIPTAAQALAAPMASQLPITPFNTVCTNVPGPQIPLYLLGHKMLRWYPWVPVGGEMAVNCAVLSYNGIAYFGFSGYKSAAPDLQRFETLLNLGFSELRKAAGIKLPRQKHTRAHAKVAALPERAGTNEQELIATVVA